MSLTLTEINSMPSLKPPLDWLEEEQENTLPLLPWEIINKILYEFGGYQTPNAKMIKDKYVYESGYYRRCEEDEKFGEKCVIRRWGCHRMLVTCYHYYRYGGDYWLYLRMFKEPNNFISKLNKNNFINNNTKSQIKETFEEHGIKFTKSHTKEKLYKTFYQFMLKD